MARLLRRFSASVRRRPRPRSPQARLLLLRTLEDRIMPTTFTVLNANDSGTGSLRDAITQSNAINNATDVIVFSNGSTGGATNFYDGAQHTISLLSALPAITGVVSITGPGADYLTVARGSGTFGIFASKAAAGNTIAMSGMTISGGNAGPGAGISLTSGNLSLTAVTVTNNNIGSGTRVGAGIYDLSGGALTITNCHIDNNSAGQAGGGMYVIGNGTVNISSSTLSGNSASDTIYSGGAMYLGAIPTVNITNSTLSGNSGFSTGGAIVDRSSGHLTIAGCTLANNRAEAGGAIFARESSTLVTVTNSIVSNNSATFAGGGAAEAVYGASLAFVGTTVSGNSAAGNGGGILAETSGSVTVTNCTFANNSAGPGGTSAGSGGAVELYYNSGAVKITSSTISGNTATTTTATAGYGGGAIAAQPAGIQTVTLDNTIISGNSAASANGSADISGAAVSAKFSALGTSAGYSLTDQGGNLTGASATPAALKLGSLTVTNGSTPTISVAAGSTAIDAGDPALAGTTDQRGVIRPQGAGVDIGAFERVPGVPSATSMAADVINVNAPLTYQFRVTYTADTAMNYATINGNSNAVTVTPPAGVPAVVVAFVSASPTSNAATITATYQFVFPVGLGLGADDGTWLVNMAPDQPSDQVFSVDGVAVPAGQFGVFHVTVPRTFTVTNTGDAGAGSGLSGDLRYCINRANIDTTLPDRIVFSNSTAGGATNFYDGARHTITLGSLLPAITDAASVIGPGANFLSVTRSLATNDIFQTGYATAISGMTIDGGNFNGFGLFTGNVTLTDVVIQNFRDAGDGSSGAIGAYGSSLKLVNCIVRNNSGGIGTGTAGDVTIIGSTIANNGGGVGVGDGFLTVTNSSITGNGNANSNKRGGAIYCYDGANITNSTIAGNTATYGGAIYGGPIGTITLTSDTIVGNTSASPNTSSLSVAGGGGIAARGNLVLDNTIVSGNISANGFNDISALMMVTAKYSAIGSTAGFALSDQGHNLIGAGLQLGQLQNNGGANLTVALGAGSPAIDAGDLALAGTTDERASPFPARSRSPGVTPPRRSSFCTSRQVIMSSCRRRPRSMRKAVRSLPSASPAAKPTQPAR